MQTALPSPTLDLSIVVPVYNEVDNVEPLIEQLTTALESTGRSYEIVAVDDGSDDGSWELLCEAHQVDERVVAVQFRRNFGQTAAFAAGFDLARGKWVITIDADCTGSALDGNNDVIGEGAEYVFQGIDIFQRVVGVAEVHDACW